MTIIISMIISVLRSIVSAIITGFAMIFKGLGLIIWYTLKYLGLGLWHGVIMLPVYIVRLFRKPKNEGAANE